MRLLFYAPPFDPSARSLHHDLTELNGVQQNEYIGSFNGLIKYLRTPLGISTFGVIWPANQIELFNLRRLRYLLRDIRIILILPDRLPQTVSDGHLLRPRFVSYADGDLTNVVEVAAKIISSQQIPVFQMAGSNN